MRDKAEPYRLWCERSLPPEYTPLLEALAVYAGTASASPDAPLSALPGAHAIIASSRIRYDGALMDRVPTLRVISRTGIGVDNISIPDATARGIAVCNVPDGPTISTAEHAIALMLAAAKQLKQSEIALRRGENRELFNDYQGREVFGLRLAVIGLGRIGSRVAQIASALGMQVIGYDPYLSAERAAAVGVERVLTLQSALETADIVSLHVPWTNETWHLIDATRLAQMKRGAILVNTAGGVLVDEAALLGALESGHLRGAGLDVFESEPPPPDNPLLHREDVIATPHIASATGASKDRLWRGAIAQALQVLRGERPPYLVNPEVWPVHADEEHSGF